MQSRTQPSRPTTRKKSEDKDSKKIRSQGPTFRGQTLSRPRTKIRGGVENTRLKVKKDTKKFRGQGQGETLSRSRTKGRLTGQGGRAIARLPGNSTEWNTFFPEFRWRPALRCTPESNYWRGCRCKPYSNYWGDTVKLLGGYSQIVGEYISPRVSEPLGFEAQAKAKDFKMCPRGLHLWQKCSRPSRQGWRTQIF